jgi:tRNA G37 N-methylase Trm5
MDNSDFNQKIAIRQKGLKLLPNPKTIVDMYAGEGHLSRNLWSKLNAQLTCIDKEQWKLNKLDFYCEKICDDNRKHISLASKADIVDLDAYGLVMKNLRDILNANRKTQLIFFTECNPFCKFMSKVVEELITLDITCFWIEKSNQSNVFYGFIYRQI